MNIFILFLLLPVAIGTQIYRKPTNPNDEPFLPIHSEYPYSPSLVKRGIEQHQEQQPQSVAQLRPEILAAKLDSRESYPASYGQNNYYPTYSPYIKSVSTPNTLATSSYYQSPYASANLSPFNQLNTYNSPYSSLTSAYGTNAQSYGMSPYANMGLYPNYYHNQPYYYPNYYNQSPFVPPPPPPPHRYYNRPSKYSTDNDDDDSDSENADSNADRLREKSKRRGSQKNRSKNFDRESESNEYIDGSNYIISRSKDLDGESSSHRIPNRYNQIEQDTDASTRTASQPKTTYRLVSISGQPPAEEYNSPGNGGYIKVQQLEQLMRQALAKLLAQNTIQQDNLARIQQEVNKHQNSKTNQHYVTVPTTIAKTGLSYIVNPTILNRVNTAQSDINLNPYVPNELSQTKEILTGNNQSYSPKSATSVTLQQSPGIYIPPGKMNNDQSSLEYGDYDASESVTIKNHQNGENFRATVEPANKNYLYSTYRPTQQTNLEDVNFGSKQKISVKS